jgi:hypothetical protein
MSLLLSLTRSALRSASTAAACLAVAIVCGCASLEETDDGDSVRMKQAYQRYVDCVTAQAEKDSANPAGAEVMAVAAHGRCWASWDAYRKATSAAFAEGARTPDERQLAHDKADARLRQVELETRQAVVERIVERTLTRKR